MKIIILCIIINFAAGLQNLAQKSDNNLLLAQAAEIEKNYTKAIENYSQIIENKSVNDIAEIHRLRGLCFFKIGNSQSAISDFEEAEKLEKSGEALFHLAQVYAYNLNAEQASKMLTMNLESATKKDNSEILKDSCFEKINRTKAWRELWQQQWYSKTEQLLQEARYAVVNKNYTDALSIFDQVLKTNKNKHEIYALRAEMYEIQHDYRNAALDYELAFKLKPSKIDYLNKKAENNRLAENFKQAERDFNLSLEKNANQLNIYYLRSKTCFETKNFTQAKIDIEFFLKFLPENIEAQILLARIFSQTDEHFEALKIYNRLLAKNKNMVELLKSRAETYIKVQTYKFAIFDLTQALDLSPHDSELYLLRGNARFESGDKKGACNDWKAASRYDNKKAFKALINNCNE